MVTKHELIIIQPHSVLNLLTVIPFPFIVHDGDGVPCQWKPTGASVGFE